MLNVVGGINVDVGKLRSPVQLRVRTAVESSTIIINMIYNLKTFSKKKMQLILLRNCIEMFYFS